MAWYGGTYSCGHEGRTQVYGPTKDRQRKADYYFETHLCPECWKKEQERKAQEAAEIAKDLGCAELTGSTKQIAWAENIRASMFSILVNHPEYRDVVEGIAKTETSAKFYIDNRDALEFIINKKYHNK